MSEEARYAAMVEFLGSFSTVSQPPQDISDLSDGVVIFEALSEIAPSYFDPTTIARHLGDNWVLKSSNLRKLVRNLQHYFREDLRKDAALLDSIDQNAIARHGDPASVAALLELVAAAAVTCPEKNDYVKRIMVMTPENQSAMKEIIESSLARLADYNNNEDMDGAGEENEMVFGQHSDDNNEYADDGMSSAREEDTDRMLFSRHHGDMELEQQLADARREIAALKSQVSISNEDAEKAQNKLRALVEDLQDRLRKRQDEISMLEDDLQATSRDLEEKKAKVATLEEERARLMDDLDMANAKAQLLHKAEATVVAYKKKLDSVGVINQQMTDLEDQAAGYLRQIMELENEVKKSNALQKTVAELQQKISELEKERSYTENSSRSAGTEIADLKSRLQAAESAKKMYEDELKELRAQQESLTEEAPAIAAPPISPVATQEQREKVMRLEIENQKLKEDVERLEAAAAQAVAAVSVAASSEDSKSALQDEIKRLREQLEIKEKENAKISSDKDKLEAYTKRTLAKFQDKYLVALQECKAKLKEKQDKIENLEQRSASERSAQKREERLLSSTIYELGLAIMQNRLKSGT